MYSVRDSQQRRGGGELRYLLRSTQGSRGAGPFPVSLLRPDLHRARGVLSALRTSFPTGARKVKAVAEDKAFEMKARTLFLVAFLAVPAVLQILLRFPGYLHVTT